MSDGNGRLHFEMGGMMSDEDRSATIREEVMQTIGSASMCWKPTPLGVFNSEQAIKWGERLVRILEQREEGLKDEVVRAQSYANALGDALARTETALVALQEKVDATVIRLKSATVRDSREIGEVVIAETVDDTLAILAPTPEGEK